MGGVEGLLYPKEEIPSKVYISGGEGLVSDAGSYYLGFSMLSSSLSQLCPLILCHSVLPAPTPKPWLRKVPDAQAQNRALATGEGRGKGNQDTGKPKLQGLTNLHWSLVPGGPCVSYLDDKSQCPPPRRSLDAFNLLNLSRAFPEVRQPLHLLEQKLKIGSGYKQCIDSNLEGD